MLPASVEMKECVHGEVGSRGQPGLSFDSNPLHPQGPSHAVPFTITPLVAHLRAGVPTAQRARSMALGGCVSRLRSSTHTESRGQAVNCVVSTSLLLGFVDKAVSRARGS